DDGADLELGQVDGAALLHSEGREADGADRRSKSGNSRRGRLDADVVGAGRSAADADAAAAAGKSRVRGAEGDGEIERGRTEDPDLCTAFRAHPAADEGSHPLLERRVLEDAAVEQDGGRMEERGAR